MSEREHRICPVCYTRLSTIGGVIPAHMDPFSSDRTFFGPCAGVGKSMPSPQKDPNHV